MGCLIGYSATYLIPKLLFSTLIILGFIRETLLAFFRLIGLPDFLEPDIDNYCPHHPVSSPSAIRSDESVSAELIREMLPVAKFSDIVDNGTDGVVEVPEGCAVCLYDFEGEEEVRRLPNCGHVFHRNCLDRWLDHDRMTCPLCRGHFVPDDMMEDFHQRLSDESAIPDFCSDYVPIDYVL